MDLRCKKENLNRGGLYVSATREKSIQTLLFWLNDSLRTVRVKVDADFDETELTTIKMTKTVNEAYIHYLEWKTDSAVHTPEKFSYIKWDICEDTVINWIQTKRGVTNLPLSYVINKDNTTLKIDHSKLIIYNDRFTTVVLTADIRKVQIY